MTDKEIVHRGKLDKPYSKIFLNSGHDLSSIGDRIP